VPVIYPESRATPDGPLTIFDCGTPLYWAVQDADETGLMKLA
jgi:hypothetical protein